jgi:hypothetical protein
MHCPTPSQRGYRSAEGAPFQLRAGGEARGEFLVWASAQQSRRLRDIGSGDKSVAGAIRLCSGTLPPASGGLAAEPQQVVLDETKATDRCVGFHATMWPMPIAAMGLAEHFG